MKNFFLTCLTMIASLTYNPPLNALDHATSTDCEDSPFFQLRWKTSRNILQCTVRYDESITLPQKFYFYTDDLSQVVVLPFFPEENYELFTSQGEKIETINFKLYLINDPSTHCLGLIQEVTLNEDELDECISEEIWEDISIQIEKQPSVIINYDQRTVTLRFERQQV